MKIYHVILNLMLLFLTINSYSQDTIKQLSEEEFEQMNLDSLIPEFDIITIFDTVTIKAIKLDSINIRFKVMLNNHIKSMKNMKKNKYCILFGIGLHLNEHHFDKNKVDSFCNLFVKGDYGDDIGYDVTIFNLQNNELRMKTLENRSKLYYYVYNGWDVFFTSALNIAFPNAGQLVELKYYLKYKDFVKSENGKYNVWQLQEKIRGKKPNYEGKKTNYYLFNHKVEEYFNPKMIYSPHWYFKEE